MAITVSKTYQDDERKLLETFLNFSLFKKESSPLYGVELIIRPECTQKCDYCYITQHGKELYPTHFSNKTILKNLDIFLNYIFNEKKLYIHTWELFAGDLFFDDLAFDIFDILLKYFTPYYELHHNSFDIFRIMIPTNASFVDHPEKIEKFKKYHEEFLKINTRLSLSFSIDGKYSADVREHSEKDDEYYDKIFSLAKELSYGFHPMISYEGIDNAIKNYDWFREQFEKYEIDRLQPMLLEVRNPNGWTDEKITKYLEFLKHLIKVRLELCNDDIETLAYHIFRRESEDDPILPTQGYDPILFDNITKFDNPDMNMISCSLSNLFHIRLGDLAIVGCHRTCYPHLIGGFFELDEKQEKIIGVKPNNVASYIAMKTLPAAYSPGCFSCTISDYCVKGCLGAQYEDSGEYLVPIQQVCNLEKAKFSFKVKTYYELGVLQKAYEKDLIEPELINIIKGLGYNLDG